METLNPDPERGEQSQVTHTHCPFRVPNPRLPPPPHHTAISLSYNYYTSISLYELFLIFLISVTTIRYREIECA